MSNSQREHGAARQTRSVDYVAIEQALQAFVDKVVSYSMNRTTTGGPTQDELVEMAAAVFPIVQAILPGEPWVRGRPSYLNQFEHMRESALRALGVVRNRESIEAMLGPQGPQISAAGLHPWVWGSAATLWDTGHFRQAVQNAATSVDVHLQNKLGRRDLHGAKAVREAFSSNGPEPGRPRLRVPGDRATPTWQARQDGARDFALGCIQGLRNPATHDLEELDEQVALEQLAALSVLSRWIEECEVELVSDGGE